MKESEQKAICLRCKHGHYMSYADGSYGTGCCYKGGLPVDIELMDYCPLGKDAHTMARYNLAGLLSQLAVIYSRASIHPAELSLTRIFNSSHVSFRGKKQFLSTALLKLNIVKVVENNGLKRTYKWITSAPSLDMAARICDKMQELYKEKYNKNKK